MLCVYFVIIFQLILKDDKSLMIIPKLKFVAYYQQMALTIICAWIFFLSHNHNIIVLQLDAIAKLQYISIMQYFQPVLRIDFFLISSFNFEHFIA